MPDSPVGHSETSAAPPTSLTVWFCKNCGWIQIRDPGGLPCVSCLTHAWDAPLAYDLALEGM